MGASHLLGIIGTISLCSSLQAALQGFGNPQSSTPLATSIEQVLNTKVEDQRIQIEGSLTKFLREDRYEFTDLQGKTIEVELDEDQNWDHLAKDQKIVIEGFVDVKEERPFIEVDTAQVLN